VLIWVPELDRMMGMLLPLVGTQLPTGLACEALRVRAKQPARLRQLLVAGSPEGETELPRGRERAYRCRPWSFSTTTV
jgi:hypothetical protein